MKKNMKKKLLMGRHYQVIFEELMCLAQQDLTIRTTSKLMKAIDLVANYCGDRYKGRKPDLK